MSEINIKDVARLAGVGVSTVSRVINDHSDVNEQTKEKVLAIIKEYGYVPNNSARNLKRSRSRTVGVLVKGITNPFFTSMIRVIEHELHRGGYSMILQQVDENEDELEVAAALWMEKRLIGVIFLGGRSSHEKSALEALKIPYVLATITLSGSVNLKKFSSVTIDDFKEAYKATDYLCKKGHKKIAVLCAQKDDISIGALRLKGFLKAMEDNGCTGVPAPLFAGEYTIKAAYDCVGALLQSGAAPTCIFAISDTLAIGASKAVLSSGRKIPDDISVMGFDGIDTAEYYEPAITTVKQPNEKIALESVHILLDVIEKRAVSRHLTFEAEIIQRQSVAGIGD